ncbi:MAG: OsmC family protein [Coriobacteriia bacterium]|nr:OsmC family protein [Coriobacteriia bacterium]
MDARPEHGGEASGMRPLQVFLCALAGCTGMDVVSILGKKRQEVTGVELYVEADQRTDEYPRIYTEIRLHFAVTGRAVEPRAVARAIELSEEKYCSVAGMLGAQTTVKTSFSIEGAGS